MPALIVKKKIDIIWNITQICMWNCEFCCVDAVNVQARGNKIIVSSESLKKKELLPYVLDTDRNYFDQALDYRKAKGLELTLDQKFTILNHLIDYDAKIDFSGGDPLAISDTLVVMQKANYMFGKPNITLTATGAGLAKANVESISPLIGELNFTYDSITDEIIGHRPKGYAKTNLAKAAQFAQAGIKTRAETPLTKKNIDENTLTQLYLDLHKAGISTHLLMRLFPSGRGIYVVQDIPNRDEYLRAIDILHKLEAHYGYPKIKLQCALKHLVSNNRAENPCDMVVKSFGLMANGTLLASPWAFNMVGKPLSDFWVLGNLVENTMQEILTTPKALNFVHKTNDNFGHCKIHSYFNGDKQELSTFKKMDPLYQTKTSGEECK
jgi:MoaA/NifB/PqqE/SkfB family radical SAM enzyme